jgi:hypothetical protein
LPQGDEDGDLLLTALAAHGVKAEWLAWDDADESWQHDLVVIRSTWDYTPRRAEFLAWTRATDRLANPAEVVTWNSDKTYLRDLAAAGVPVVPTDWFEPGRPAELPTAGEYVVKPSVGAGSLGAGRFTGTDRPAALAHIDRLHAAGRTAMVQPYLDGVDVTGERAVIYVDGGYSHTVTKGAMLPSGVVHDVAAPLSSMSASTSSSTSSLFVEERIQPAEPSAAERAVADAVMDEVARRFGVPMLYARVDLLPSVDGPLLLELELVEPSLFLGYAAGAADRFAAAIAART